MSSDSAVVVDSVSKRYRLWHESRQSLKEVVLRRGRGRYEDFWALRDVSFEVERGESFGVVGSNGSGKSTLLKILAGILVPEEGSVACNGRLSALLELGAGFHPELTGRENIFLNGSIIGLTRKQLHARLDSIIAFAELEEFIDSPIRSYSSGMYVRLGFSVAVHSDPDILLVDEVLGVGDESFQRKSAERILQIREQGATIIVVSHSLNQIRGMCRRAIWIDKGKLASEGLAENVILDYLRSVTGEEPEYVDPSKSGDLYRWGSGEVKVEKVEVFGRAPSDPPRTGEPMTVRLHYTATERVERPVFGVGLHRSDGLHVTGPNTRDAGYEIPFVEGEGIVDLSLAKCQLLPARYLLSVAVTDYTLTHPFDFHERLHKIEIRSGDDRESRGVVTLDGTWRVSAGAVESSS